jgi:aryl-phospho-beta-D-glucosidase BglC (GH1 family)
MLTLSASILQAQSFESATDAVKNMGVGWNLGNTLDATKWGQAQGWNWPSVTAHENEWGQPTTKPELLKMMKEAGFGAIRVPVTWFQEMDSNGKVKAEWMKRVHEVVDYVINNGMYCILNVHHDTGEGKDHWLYANTTCYNKVKDTYQYLWQQIAAEFKNYDQKLLFESYNEMLDKYGSWNYAMSNRTGGYDETEAKDAYNAINQFAQLFVNTVRSSGGNNDKRNLVVNTYGACCGGKWGTNELPMEPLKQMKLPTDMTTGHLIFQVHSYPGLKSNNLSSIKTQVTTMMSDLKTVLAAKGAPVIIGEWGTLNDGSDVNYTNNKTNYLDFCKHFVTEAKKNDIATFYWMGLSDGVYRSEVVFSQPDLAEAITKAYHGSSFEGKYPVHDSSKGTVAFEGEKVLEWGQGITIKAAMLKEAGNKVQVEITYKLDFTDYDDMQFMYNKGGWQKITVGLSMDGKSFDGADFSAASFYGIQSGVSKTSTLTFNEAAYELVSVNDLVIQGHGVIISKVVVKAPEASGIKNTVIYQNDDNTIYNLQGQRVENPQHGIYIRNGKKFVVK